MKKFDLNAYGVEEMGVNEMCTVDGGWGLPLDVIFLPDPFKPSPTFG